ncbi:MAG: CcoQ/FixQ family Cbb3-type cytochrome c oxidase assembly chaperone [Bdellovibrionales bacterium]|nr:CcoQ/FixQ family Cbb3-type cytochrome c oxidase assembly chaperone [Bdellovibrionales bacterium]
MGAILKETVLRSGVADAAIVVLLVVAAFFVVIAAWALRKESKPLFDRASRLPFDEKEQ